MENKKETNDQNKIAYLQLIQEPIGRMSNIGAIIKGFAITTVATLIFVDLGTRKYLCFIPLVIVVALMFFDAYYLLLERKFRLLYNKVAKGEIEEPYDYSLNIANFDKQTLEEKNVTFKKCLLAGHIKYFYGILIILLIVVILFIYGILPIKK